MIISNIVEIMQIKASYFLVGDMLWNVDINHPKALACGPIDIMLQAISLPTVSRPQPSCITHHTSQVFCSSNLFVAGSGVPITSGL